MVVASPPSSRKQVGDAPLLAGAVTGVKASTHRNRALHGRGCACKRRRSLALFAESGELPEAPESKAAKRADKTPGAPAKASTSRPESSAKTNQRSVIFSELANQRAKVTAF